MSQEENRRQLYLKAKEDFHRTWQLVCMKCHKPLPRENIQLIFLTDQKGQRLISKQSERELFDQGWGMNHTVSGYGVASNGTCPRCGCEETAPEPIF